MTLAKDVKTGQDAPPPAPTTVDATTPVDPVVDEPVVDEPVGADWLDDSGESKYAGGESFDDASGIGGESYDIPAADDEPVSKQTAVDDKGRDRNWAQELMKGEITEQEYVDAMKEKEGVQGDYRKDKGKWTPTDPIAKAGRTKEDLDKNFNKTIVKGQKTYTDDEGNIVAQGLSGSGEPKGSKGYEIYLSNVKGTGKTPMSEDEWTKKAEAFKAKHQKGGEHYIPSDKDLLGFEKKDMERVQKYKDKGWAQDDTINAEAWDAFEEGGGEQNLGDITEEHLKNTKLELRRVDEDITLSPKKVPTVADIVKSKGMAVPGFGKQEVWEELDDESRAAFQDEVGEYPDAKIEYIRDAMDKDPSMDLKGAAENFDTMQKQEISALTELEDFIPAGELQKMLEGSEKEDLAEATAFTEQEAIDANRADTEFIEAEAMKAQQDLDFIESIKQRDKELAGVSPTADKWQARKDWFEKKKIFEEENPDQEFEQVVPYPKGDTFIKDKYYKATGEVEKIISDGGEKGQAQVMMRNPDTGNFENETQRGAWEDYKATQGYDSQSDADQKSIRAYFEKELMPQETDPFQLEDKSLIIKDEDWDDIFKTEDMPTGEEYISPEEFEGLPTFASVGDTDVGNLLDTEMNEQGEIYPSSEEKTLANLPETDKVDAPSIDDAIKGKESITGKVGEIIGKGQQIYGTVGDVRSLAMEGTGDDPIGTSLSKAGAGARIVEKAASEIAKRTGTKVAEKVGTEVATKVGEQVATKAGASVAGQVASTVGGKVIPGLAAAKGAWDTFKPGKQSVGERALTGTAAAASAVSSAVLATNFWNPVGWAAGAVAIGASIAGAMGLGGGTNQASMGAGTSRFYDKKGWRGFGK
jgi:hypothetical protein